MTIAEQIKFLDRYAPAEREVLGAKRDILQAKRWAQYEELEQEIKSVLHKHRAQITSCGCCGGAHLSLVGNYMISGSAEELSYGGGS